MNQGKCQDKPTAISVVYTLSKENPEPFWSPTICRKTIGSDFIALNFAARKTGERLVGYKVPTSYNNLVWPLAVCRGTIRNRIGYKQSVGEQIRCNLISCNSKHNKSAPWFDTCRIQTYKNLRDLSPTEWFWARPLQDLFPAEFRPFCKNWLNNHRYVLRIVWKYSLKEP